MSKIQCPNCGRTNCDHWKQDNPKQELPPPPYSEASPPTRDEARQRSFVHAQKIIELGGEDGYRSAAYIIGPDETDGLLANLVAQNMGTTSDDEEVRKFVAEVRARKGF